MAQRGVHRHAIAWPHLLLVVSTAACTGVVEGWSGSDDDAGLGGPGAPVQGQSGGAGNSPQPLHCDTPGSRPVPKLLRLSNAEYQNIVSDVLATPVDSELFVAWTPVAEVYGFDTMSETRIDARSLDEQLRTSEELARLALQSAALTSACPSPVSPTAPAQGATPLTWDNCGAAVMNQLASRAFRRPLRADELTGYQQLAQSSELEAAGAVLPHPFYEGLTTAVQAALLSPYLMFKPELVPGGLDATERAYRVASKLASFFRGSVPDDELWSLAESGALDDPAVIEQQAERLLEQYQERFLRNFAGQWLDFRDVPTGADALLSSMRDETEAVFREVLAAGLPPQSLMAPGFTIVDRAVATHYGLAFQPGGAPVQTLTTDARGGLLSHGYFLSRTASGSEFRRPIHRGLWVMTRLLCREIPRLDAATVQEISASFEAIDRTLPLSAQMEIHRSTSPRCYACHGEIDPIGLALEKYDKQGLWREIDDNGHPIVSDLQLFGQPVGDPLALAATIASSEEYRTCVATKALTYALNRGPTASEGCVAQALASPGGGEQPSLGAIAIGAVLRSLELTEPTP